MYLQPAWKMSGLLTEKRELKTKKDEVWAYALKVMALGGMYSVTTKDRTLYDKAGEGEPVTLAGSFEQYNGNLQLTLSSIESSEPAAKGRAS